MKTLGRHFQKMKMRIKNGDIGGVMLNEFICKVSTNVPTILPTKTETSEN